MERLRGAAAAASTAEAGLGSTWGVVGPGPPAGWRSPVGGAPAGGSGLIAGLLDDSDLGVDLLG